MIVRIVTLIVVVLAAAGAAAASEIPQAQPEVTNFAKALPSLETPDGLSAVLRWLVVITLLSLAPAILIMVTCFTRIIVVLGLLRQALTTQSMPPNQVLLAWRSS